MTRVRHGVTLVEAMVALALATVLSWSLWYVFTGAQKDAQAADRRLTAVSTAQRISVMLESDLSALAPRYEAGGEVTVDGAGRRLRFEVGERPAPPAPIKLHVVTWSYDPGTFGVVRTLGKAVEPLKNVAIADLIFRVSSPPDLGLAAAPAALPDADMLHCWVVWAPREDLAAGKPSARDATTVALSFGLPRRSDLERYPGWLANPTSKYQPVDD